MLILAGVVPLAGIIREDFKYRAIHWLWLFILLGCALLPYEWQLKSIIVNTSFVFVQLAGLTIYFSIKEGRLVNVIDRLIGIGDILFLVAIAPLFSPVNYIGFVACSFLLTVVTYPLVKKQMTQPSIPLAGFMSIHLVLLLMLSLTLDISLTNDLWLIQTLYQY